MKAFGIPIDFTKPIQTRDGRKVRILATDVIRAAGGSVVGVVPTGSGTEMVTQWYSDGTFLAAKQSHNLDLVNVPEESFVYQNVYPRTNGDGLYVGCEHKTREDADRWASGTRVGCMKIKLERRFDD